MPGDPVHPKYLAAIRSGIAEKLVIVLDDAELSEAQECGALRLKRAKSRKRKDYLGQDSIESHVMGAQGERAFSKFIGEPWKCSLNGFGGAADVRGVQVRTVPKTSSDMKVRKDDPDRRPVVLIVAHPPRFWVRGFLLAGEARKLGTVADPGDRGRPATFVRPELLRPMQEFLHDPRVRAALGIAPEEA